MAFPWALAPYSEMSINALPHNFCQQEFAYTYTLSCRGLDAHHKILHRGDIHPPHGYVPRLSSPLKAGRLILIVVQR